MNADLYAGALVPSVSIENLIRQRDGVLEKLQAACDLFREARELAQETGERARRFAGQGFTAVKFGWDPMGQDLFAYNSSLMFTDTFTKVLNTHAIKAGLSVERGRKDQNFQNNETVEFIYSNWGNGTTGNVFGDTLTARQLDILPLLAEGMPNKQIADALGVTEGTVKQHLKELFKRLSARNRTQAVQEARRLGLLRK